MQRLIPDVDQDMRVTVPARRGGASSRKWARTFPCRRMQSCDEKFRRAARVSCRLHDLRHSFCTKLAEPGVPESTMLDMMGHMSAAMLRRYSHIRAKARREAIAAIEARVFDGVAEDSAQAAPSEAKAKIATSFVS